MDKVKLTAEAVRNLAMSCLFDDAEVPDLDLEGRIEWAKKNAVIVQGIMGQMAFNPAKIEKHKQDIINLVSQTDDNFRADSTAGGWSFLNLCIDKEGHHWGEHRDMETLVCLATAAKLGGYFGDRETWEIMPGGMPYVQFNY